mgnify:CR=1 FL=1
MQNSLNRGNQEIVEGMSFEDDLSLLTKLDVITLQVQLDTIMLEIEQKRNVNANYMICNLYRGYHVIHICKHKMWIIMMNLGIIILVLIKTTIVWGVLMLMVAIINVLIALLHIFIITNPNLYKSKLSWELAIERLANASLP